MNSLKTLNNRIKSCLNFPSTELMTLMVKYKLKISSVHFRPAKLLKLRPWRWQEKMRHWDYYQMRKKPWPLGEGIRKAY